MSKRSIDIRRKGDIAGKHDLLPAAMRLTGLQGPACGRFMR